MTKDLILKYKIPLAIYLFLAFLSFNYFDAPVAHFFLPIDGTQWEIILEYITELGDSKYYLLTTPILYFLLRKYYTNIATMALFIFFTTISSGLIVNLLKGIFGRYRPARLFDDNNFGFDWFHWNDYMMNSFPSGHSATSLSVGVALALIFPKLRWFFILVFIFVAFTRVMITVHYVSDVMIGGLIGGVTSLYFYYNYYQKRVKKD